MLFLGRQYNYPIALEGALKMKEICYINANGHPSAELKHGIIALIRPELPSVFIAPDDTVFDKNLSNIEEVKARKGPVIAVGTEGATGPLEHICDDVIYMPRTLDSSPRCSRSSRCSSSPTTWRCTSAATSTSRAISPRA